MRPLVALVIAMLPRLVVAQPAEVQREFQAGVDAFRLGKLDEAKQHLETAKRLDPTLPGPPRFLAAVAKAQERWVDCIAESRHAIELNPKSKELADTAALHEACRIGAGRPAYAGTLDDGAAIAVTTNVPGATVKVRGLMVGGTPLAPRPITAGPLEIELAKAGWKLARVTIAALPGIVTDVIVDLEADPEAKVRVESHSVAIQQSPLTPEPSSTSLMLVAGAGTGYMSSALATGAGTIGRVGVGAWLKPEPEKPFAVAIGVDALVFRVEDTIVAAITPRVELANDHVFLGAAFGVAGADSPVDIGLQPALRFDAGFHVALRDHHGLAISLEAMAIFDDRVIPCFSLAIAYKRLH